MLPIWQQFRKVIGWSFADHMREELIVNSFKKADNPYDNAFMESYFSRFKAEMLEGEVFQCIEDARTEIFDYIEMYYNPKRRHSAIGYRSPADFEKANKL